VSQYFEIHPSNPQPRLIRRVVNIINDGGVIAYPTDSCYALGCHIGDKAAMQRIRAIRRVGSKHNFTLMCRDLSDIATYSRVDNSTYRLLKTLTPGPFTFILQATSEVPRRLQNPKRKTIGIRVPDNIIAQALLAELGQPLMSSTLILPDQDTPMTEPDEIRDVLEYHVDVVIGGGHCGFEPTTVVLIERNGVEVTRHGKGDVSLLD
jgi:tRNA threonylcarbamoyl adenosine modification protein (Sua5/YciO/YrdC/YwlC family)